MSRVTRQGFLNSIQHAFSNKPGKLDIKRRESGILFTSLQDGFTLQKALSHMTSGGWLEKNMDKGNM